MKDNRRSIELGHSTRAHDRHCFSYLQLPAYEEFLDGFDDLSPP
jgi:hypothetical protein